MNKELLDAIAKYSLEKLIDILIRKDEYEKTAINYAKDELARRNLTQTEIDALFQMRLEVYEKRILRETSSLSVGWKILYMLFPVVIPIYAALPFIMKHLLPQPPGFVYWRENGFHRKASQACWYTFLGVVLWFLAISLWFYFSSQQVHRNSQ